MSHQENERAPGLTDVHREVDWFRDHISADLAGAKRLARRFLACNPFYLLSAALLLWGLHLLWQDSVGLTEGDQLLMNFYSLQGYEVLLAATAILLARRAIWYDSFLLVGIEQVFLFIPFVLLSMATWLEGSAGVSGMAWQLVGLGGLLAVVRLAAVRRFCARLNMPRTSLALGLLLLGYNILLPFLFKAAHAGSAAGVRPESGVVDLIVANWLFVMPLVVLLANLLPADGGERPTASAPLCARQWTPFLLLGIWVAVTAYHLWAIGYVYDVAWRAAWLGPGLWAFLWTLYLRRRLFSPMSRAAEGLLLSLPAIALLASYTPELNGVFLLSTLVNVAAYGWLAASGARLPRYLLLISLAAVMAFIPEGVGRTVMAEFSRRSSFGGAALGFLLLLAVLHRHVLLGIGGAVGLGLLLSHALVPLEHGRQLALQAGFAFALLHSLRWPAKWEWLHNLLRLGVGAVWLVHTLAWLHFDLAWTSKLWSSGFALAVLLGFGVRTLLCPAARPRLVLYAGVAVLVLQPFYPILVIVAEGGAGVITIFGAFLLFAAGTALACSRDKWEGEEPAPAAEFSGAE